MGKMVPHLGALFTQNEYETDIRFGLMEMLYLKEMPHLGAIFPKTGLTGFYQKLY